MTGLGGTANAPVPTEAGFERTSDLTWEWRFVQDQYVLVEVDRTYAVTGVNHCTDITS
jgi:hypothetical protein